MTSLWTSLQTHISHAASLLSSALVSRGWIYPLQGIVYLVSHPSLHKALYPVLSQLLISAVVTTVGLLLTLPIQSAFFFFLGPLAPVAALLLILAEGCIAVLVLSRTLFGDVQDELFDAVLLQQGHDALVMKGRGLQQKPGGAKKLGAALSKPLKRLSKESLVRYIVSLPLNALPVVGTVLFLAYNGTRSGPAAHSRYFQLKGFSQEERDAFVKQRQGSYTAFGISSLVLGMIPIAGIVFGLTSSVGAALWASNLEKKDPSPGSVSEGRKPAAERVEL